MEPIPTTDTELTDERDERTEEELLVLAWRAEQLRRVGLPRNVAVAFAGLVDWHQIAALVARGCSPELALEITR